MKDIGEQVRELLPEYPHLWSRVIAWAEKSYELAHAQGKLDAAEFLQTILVQPKKRGEK